MRLMLASASPRRAELLRLAGFTFDTLVVDVDESVRAGEAPAEYVRRLAMEKSAKALALSSVVSGFNRTREGPPDRLRQGYGGPPKRSAKAEGGHSVREDLVVLGADTAVVVDQDILGKPCADDDAREMLRRLSGRAHEVMTGVSLRCTAGEAGGVEITTVWFRSLSGEEISWYVASGEGRDKAGAYAIQGLASRFIPRIDGSYTNVVGLPIAKVAELLTEIRRLLEARP